jgi:hypothetical protein
MDGPYTRELAENIASSAFNKLPASVVEFTKLLVLAPLGGGINETSLPCDTRHCTAGFRAG